MKQDDLELTISLQAQLDIQEAVEWYETQAAHLGDRFLTDLQQTFDIISFSPQSSGFYKNNFLIRKGRLNYFPYNVFYIVEKIEIKIIAVIHSARSSRYVKRRLR